jgi:hypothetical protein
MRTRIAPLLVAAVAASSLLFTGLASAGTSARTTLTIRGPNGDFQGRIKSPDPDCVGERVVRLFMSESADGPFERTGNSDTSEQQGDVGVWSMGNTGLRDGFFFVRTGRVPGCRADRSKVLELVDGVPQ